MIKKETSLENIDISHLRGMNNKKGNIKYLLRFDVFSRICKKFESLTDTSYIYIPLIENKKSITKNNITRNYIFHENKENNNFADLMIGNVDSAKEQIAIKVSRVKSLHCINIDGRHLTFNSNDRQGYNYFLFYSVCPNEQNQAVIINENIYRFILKNNYNAQLKYFDIDWINKFKNTFNFSDKEIQIFNFSEELNLTKEEKKNISYKKQYILKTLNNLHKIDSKNRILFKRTHNGNEYIAINILTEETIHFRDCSARNNFLLKNKILKKIDNHYILQSCKTMNDIVSDIKVDKNRANIFDNGWIIILYHDDIDLKNYIQKLFTKLSEKSIYWKNKINNILNKANKKIFDLMNNFENKISKLIKNTENIIKAYKPLKLWEFVIDNIGKNINWFLQINYKTARYYKFKN